MFSSLLIRPFALDPMRIGIDVSMTADPKTGLPSYTRSLVEALARIDRQNDYWLYPITWHSFPPNYRDAVRPRARNFRTVCGRLPTGILRSHWEHGDRRRLLGPPPDVYFSPFHNVPHRWFPRLVCVFHDVSFRVHPEFSTEANRVYCEEQFDRALRLADRIVTVSQFSKGEMVRHMGVPESRIDVVYEAADPRFRRLESAEVPARFRETIGGTPFVLYVGAVEPRKNLATLIEAYAKLQERTRDPAKLVIAGGTGWKNTSVFEAVERHGLGDRVHFLGFVSDQELLNLYNTCTLFCYPSLYEGFGLPVIEAMVCGAPVVTSRVASLPEVGGGAVRYVDEPKDVDMLSLALQEVLEDDALREDLRRRGMQQAASFDWDRTAWETLAILKKVVEDQSLDPTAVVVGEDERGLEAGFFETERPPEGPFRWMQRSGTALLRLRPGNRILRVEAASPVSDATLIARVAEGVVGTGRLGDMRSFSFPLPAGFRPEGLVRVRLNVNRVLSAAYKEGDSRELGARVRRIELAS